jgi:predicted ATPase/DNA-binding XRE family transcriptional regulator
MLRTFRRQASLTQEELSERSGISVRAITDIERGQRKHPHRNTLDAIADALVLTGRERDLFTRRAALRPAATLAPPIHVHGRQRELELATARLADENVRLLTLTGAGGIGKTTLANALVTANAPRFPGSAASVWLDQLDNPDLVPAAAAEALGAYIGQHRPPLQAIADHVGTERTLLLLDNTEHLLPGITGVIDALLAAAPGLTILTTGREPLHLPGECLLTLPALPIPEPDDRSTASLSASPAIKLFQERAGRAGLDSPGADDDIADEALLAVADIVRVLDGMPLAIELAAAISSYLAPVFLRNMLQDPVFPAIRDPARITRHRSMQDAIAWSYARLPTGQQALFRALSACPAGFDLDMARAVMDSDASASTSVVRSDLLSLLNKHLIVSDDASDGGSRFRMLRPIREEALRLRNEAGESAAIRGRHAQAAARAAIDLRIMLDGPHPEDAMRRFPSRVADLQAAIAWVIAQGQCGSLLPLTVALGRWLVVSGSYDEATRTVDATAALLDRQGWRGLEDADILRFHSFAAHAMVRAGLGDAANSHVQRLWRLGAERSGAGMAGFHGLAESLGSLIIGYTGGKPDDAISACRRAIPLLEAYGDSYLLARALTFTAWPLLETGRVEEAAETMERSLAIRAAARSTLDTPYLMAPLAIIRATAGRGRAAADLLLLATDRAVDHHDPGGIGLCVSFSGVVAFIDQPSPESARTCLELIAAALSLAERHGLRYGSGWHEVTRTASAQAVAMLGPEAAAAATSDGAALDTESALAIAEETLRAFSSDEPSPETP